MKTMKVLLGLLCVISLAGTLFAWNNGSWTEGNLQMDKNKIQGDPTDGIAFDPDKDGTTEIVFEANGDITTSGTINISTGNYQTITATTAVVYGLLTASSATVTNTVTAGTFTDGVLSINNGDITAGNTVSFRDGYIDTLYTENIWGTGTPDLIIQDASGASITLNSGLIVMSTCTVYGELISDTSMEAPIGIFDNIYSTTQLTSTQIGSSGSSLIGLGIIDTAAYNDVNDFINTTWGAGWISGGAITDNGDGTFDVGEGEGMIRATNSNVAELFFIEWSTSSNIAIANDSSLYVGVDYNSGSPVVVTTDTYSWNYNTDFFLGVINRQGSSTDLHIANIPQRINKVPTEIVERFEDTDPLAKNERFGGLILGETGTRSITFSQGKLWEGLNETTISAIDTTAGDTVDSYYYNGAAWVEATGITQWDNDNYVNAGTLTSMISNRHSNLWFYIDLDGGLFWIYDTAQYVSAARAEAASPPATLPVRANYHARLAAQLVFQKGGGTAEAILDLISDVSKNASVVSDHANLSNLDYASAAHTGFAGTGVANTFTSSQTITNTVEATEVVTSTVSATDGTGLYLVDDGNNGIFIEDGGDVGIQVANPVVPLHIDGGSDVSLAGGGYFVIGLTNDTNIGFDNNEIMGRYNNTSSPLYIQKDGGDLYIGETDNVGIGTTNTPQKLSITGQIRMNQSAGLWNNLTLGLGADGDVLVVSDINDISGDTGADIIFGAGSSSDTATAAWADMFPADVPRNEFMRIKGATGRVGISTTSPQELLHIWNTGSATRMEVESETNHDAAYKATTSSSSYGWYADGTTNSFKAYDYNATANRMIINEDGDVGIGDITPTYKLDVAGNINADYGIIASTGTFDEITSSTGTFKYVTISSYTVTTDIDCFANASFGVQLSSKTIGAAYTIEEHDATLILVAPNAGGANVNFPLASASNIGRIITVVNGSGANDNLTCKGTFSGVSDHLLANQWEYITVQSIGVGAVGWVIISQSD